MTGSLRDTGFQDENVVRPLIRRLKAKAALNDVRASADTLLHLLNQQSDPLPRDRPAIGDATVRLAPRDIERGLGDVRVGSAERNAMREHELLEGIEMVAQLLDRVEIGLRHGLFSCSNGQEASESERRGHRLCGGAK